MFVRAFLAGLVETITGHGPERAHGLPGERGEAFNTGHDTGVSACDSSLDWAPPIAAPAPTGTAGR